MEHITLVGLEQLAERLVTAKALQAAKELEADEAKAKALFIEQVLLPNSMREVQLTEFRMASGKRIIMDQNISAKVTDATMPQAEEFLTEKGLDGIIKHLVVAEFGKGENENATQVMEALKELQGEGLIGEGSLLDKKSIHFQTLTATIREMLRQGVEFPEEPFNLFITDQVKIK